MAYMWVNEAFKWTGNFFNMLGRKGILHKNCEINEFESEKCSKIFFIDKNL